MESNHWRAPDACTWIKGAKPVRAIAVKIDSGGRFGCLEFFHNIGPLPSIVPLMSGPTESAAEATSEIDDTLIKITKNLREMVGE